MSLLCFPKLLRCSSVLLIIFSQPSLIASKLFRIACYRFSSEHCFSIAFPRIANPPLPGALLSGSMSEQGFSFPFRVYAILCFAVPSQISPGLRFSISMLFKTVSVPGISTPYHFAAVRFHCHAAQCLPAPFSSMPFSSKPFQFGSPLSNSKPYTSQLHVSSRLYALLCHFLPLRYISLAPVFSSLLFHSVSSHCSSDSVLRFSLASRLRSQRI